MSHGMQMRISLQVHDSKPIINFGEMHLENFAFPKNYRDLSGSDIQTHPVQICRETPQD